MTTTSENDAAFGRDDPLLPSAVLPASETIVWEGRPGTMAARSKPERVLRIAGYVMLVCFVFFALIGWGNRDELEGAVGFLVAFLVLSGGGAVFFLWGLPLVIRAGRARTRYGVTDSRAVIVHGLGGRRLTLMRIAAGYDVRMTQVARGAGDLVNVVFGETVTRTRVKPDAGNPANGHADIRRLQQFEALAPEDARAAHAALMRIRGVGSGPMVEVRKI